MAIAKKITFEGNKYYLGNKDRVSAFTAITSDWRGIVGSGSVGISAVSSGELFVTSSRHLNPSGSDAGGFDVICIKK